MKIYLLEKDGIAEYDRERLKSIKIQDYLSKVSDPRGIIAFNYNRLCEYFDDDVPEYINEEFKSDPYKDYILENLMTHDADMLIRKFKDNFSFFDIKQDISYDENSGKRFISLTIHFNNNVDIDNQFVKEARKYKDVIDFLNSPVMNDFANFFGYSISNVSSKGCGYFNISFEPIYSTDVSSIVYGKYKGRLYHVCDEAVTDYILKNGLRIKSKESPSKYWFNDDADANNAIYRTYPKRIYFFMTDNIRSINDEMIKSYTLHDRYNILQVDVSGLGIIFYSDTYAKREGYNNSIYCYNNIPPNRISLIV